MATNKVSTTSRRLRSAQTINASGIAASSVVVRIETALGEFRGKEEGAVRHDLSACRNPIDHSQTSRDRSLCNLHGR